MAARCVQGQLAACVLAKQRFRTAVADAAQSAQVKITVAESSTMPRACWLKATRYGLLGVLLWLPAAARLSSALTLRLGRAARASPGAVVQACCCWLAYSKGMRLPSICLIGCINKCGWQRAAEMKHDLLFLLHGNAAAATRCLPAAINVNTCMQLLQHQPHHTPVLRPLLTTGKATQPWCSSRAPTASYLPAFRSCCRWRSSGMNEYIAVWEVHAESDGRVTAVRCWCNRQGMSFYCGRGGLIARAISFWRVCVCE